MKNDKFNLLSPNSKIKKKIPAGNSNQRVSSTLLAVAIIHITRKTRGIRALLLDNDGLDVYYHHPRKIRTNWNYDGKTKETKVVYSHFVIALLNERDS